MLDILKINCIFDQRKHVTLDQRTKPINIFDNDSSNKCTIGGGVYQCTNCPLIFSGVTSAAKFNQRKSALSIGLFTAYDRFGMCMATLWEYRADSGLFIKGCDNINILCVVEFNWISFVKKITCLLHQFLC